MRQVGTRALPVSPSSSPMITVDSDTRLRRRCVVPPGSGWSARPADGEEAIADERPKLEPRVVVMDLAMPGVSGVDATRRLMAQRESARRS